MKKRNIQKLYNYEEVYYTETLTMKMCIIQKRCNQEEVYYTTKSVCFIQY